MDRELHWLQSRYASCEVQKNIYSLRGTKPQTSALHDPTSISVISDIYWQNVILGVIFLVAYCKRLSVSAIRMYGVEFKIAR
jgi:hypothetical protein